MTPDVVLARPTLFVRAAAAIGLDGSCATRPDAAPVEAAEGSRLRATSADLAIAAAVALIGAGFGIAFTIPAWSPRFAVLLAMTLPGLVALTRLVVSGDRSARAAAALLGWFTLCGAVSENPTVALLGQMSKESSALILAGLLGAWALGRSVSEAGRRLVMVTMLVVFGLHAVVAFVQVLTRSTADHIGLMFGRAIGLTLNPVFLGGLMAGAVAMAATTAAMTQRRSTSRAALAAVVVFGAATNLSGSRVALASALAVVLFLAVRRGWRRGSPAALAVVAGAALGELVFLVSGATASTTRHAARNGIGSGGRSDIWGYAVEAVRDRPLFGHGAGRFRVGVQEHYSVEFMRTGSWRTEWLDAHNLVIEFAVATGILGVVLLGWFLYRATRSARGPAAAVFVAVAATWLLQPMSLATAPVALVALGLSVPRHAFAPSPRTRRWRQATIASLGAGCLLAGWFAVSDLGLAAAIESEDHGRVVSAAARLPDDAYVADLVTQSAARQLADDDSWGPAVVAASQRAAALEPDRPFWWIKLAGAQIDIGDTDAARESLDHVMNLQPNHPMMWAMLYGIGASTGDTALVAEAGPRLCALRPDMDLCATR